MEDELLGPAAMGFGIVEGVHGVGKVLKDGGDLRDGAGVGAEAEEDVLGAGVPVTQQLRRLGDILADLLSQRIQILNI